MVIFKDKRFITNSEHPDDDFVGNADYVIPGNDDAIRAIKLISSVLADAVIEGKQGEQNAPAEETEENKDAE